MFAKPIGSDWPIGTPHVLNSNAPPNLMPIEFTIALFETKSMR